MQEKGFSAHQELIYLHFLRIGFVFVKGTTMFRKNKVRDICWAEFWFSSTIPESIAP